MRDFPCHAFAVRYAPTEVNKVSKYHDFLDHDSPFLDECLTRTCNMSFAVCQDNIMYFAELDLSFDQSEEEMVSFFANSAKK